MAETKREPMSNVDAAWYYMEDPTNLMMVCGVMYFESPIERSQLLDVIEKRFLTFSRFRQRVIPGNPVGGLQWEEDPHFDIDNHVISESLPGEGGYEKLKQRSSELMSEPLSFERPLWTAHLVDNCGEGSAVIMRVHHCIADGIALVGVLLSMTGATAEESLALPDAQSDRDRFTDSGHLVRFAENALHNVNKATNKMFDMLAQPSKILSAAKFGADSALTAAKLVMRAPDPDTPFKGSLGVPKIATWSNPVPLDDVKKIKGVTRGTVNDVLLTAMAGGLGRYLRGRNFDTRELAFRAAVPVNLRDPKKFRELGNKFGLVFLDLPIGIEDPLDRLFEVKKNMDAIKSSPEAVVALGMLRAVGTTPGEIQKTVVNYFGAKSTAVMTNVPGPKEPLYLAGQKMDHMMFWVPRSGRVGLGISILSYAGQVRLGVASDANLTPDPEAIVDGFHAEFEDMMNLARQVED